MSMTNQALLDNLNQRFGEQLETAVIAKDEVTIEVAAEHLLAVCEVLKSDPEFLFTTFIDLCGMDYSAYGATEWATEDATTEGFSRGVENDLPREANWDKPRFGSVIHLLSIEHNIRIRLRTFVSESDLMIPSVTGIWAAADWFERESFDLFGILYQGHNDLRRILTDYGFVGHPFRKDFPLIGNVEMRYDAQEQRCVYEPVSIEPRVLVPRVIREDQRYSKDQDQVEAD
jgi:NADH-quinone oxidoreductase subunit C